MPTLDWIGKRAVENHHKEVPYRLLKCVPELSVGEPGSGNLLVQGDNLEALKALLPYYGGKVKCIYIDPPYNTGNENWVYNDAVNSPEMRAWLGAVVGRDDLSRHDKWLCMMYPRLALLREFLTEDGAIFISIDDTEAAHLRLVLDAIFGEQNCVCQVSWIKRVSPANDAKYFSSDHEYILIFARDINLWRPNRLTRNESQLANYQNPDDDPRGSWNSVTYTCNKSAEERPNLYHGIKNPRTGEIIWPKKTAVWKYDASRHEQNEREGLVWWGKNGTAKMPRLKRFLNEVGDVVPRSFFHYDDCGHTQGARGEILDLIPECPFTTPKPTRLLQRILEIGTKPGDLILDSFAGSGTTGQAVLQLNNQEQAARSFILVEMDSDIARHITTERLRLSTDGYRNRKGERVEGLGGGFRFCELGATLFAADGSIQEEVKFKDLAQHVFFAEMREPLPNGKKDKSPLLGVARGTAVYLLYNGILKDKDPKGGNVLTLETLKYLPPHDGPKVVYGTACTLGERTLARHGITFRQIPYEVKAS